MIVVIFFWSVSTLYQIIHYNQSTIIFVILRHSKTLLLQIHYIWVQGFEDYTTNNWHWNTNLTIMLKRVLLQMLDLRSSEWTRGFHVGFLGRNVSCKTHTPIQTFKIHEFSRSESENWEILRKRMSRKGWRRGSERKRVRRRRRRGGKLNLTLVLRKGRRCGPDPLLFRRFSACSRWKLRDLRFRIGVSPRSKLSSVAQSP